MFNPKQPAFSCYDRRHLSDICHFRAEIFSKGGAGPQLLWGKSIILPWLEMGDSPPDVCCACGLTNLLEDLKAFPRETQFMLPSIHPLRHFLQQRLSQVRSNLDFQNECCKPEANRVNVFRDMLLNSHNVLKIRTYLYANEDYWLLKIIKPYGNIGPISGMSPRGRGWVSVFVKWGALCLVHYRPLSPYPLGPFHQACSHDLPVPCRNLNWWLLT